MLSRSVNRDSNREDASLQSWMDYSIRMRLRDGNNDDSSSSVYIDMPVPLPPISAAQESEMTHGVANIVDAEVVELCAINNNCNQVQEAHVIQQQMSPTHSNSTETTASSSNVNTSRSGIVRNGNYQSFISSSCCI